MKIKFGVVRGHARIVILSSGKKTKRAKLMLGDKNGHAAGSFDSVSVSVLF